MRTNWAGNYTYEAKSLLEPRTLGELQELVARAHKVKAVGSYHSFNSVADTVGDQISLGQLNNVISINDKDKTVCVEGGIRYAELAMELDRSGFALANLASLPHISVAGAISTASHGSGSNIGNLATQIVEIDVVGPNGDIKPFSMAQNPTEFAAAVVSLGAVGVYSAITLKVEPKYLMRQTVYLGLSHAQLSANFSSIFNSGTSVSAFTLWRGHTTSAVWVKKRLDKTYITDLTDLTGVYVANEPLNPIPGGISSNCTEQLGKVETWYKKLPHFRMDFSPSFGSEIQAEYFIPFSEAPAAIQAMQSIGDELASVLLISEVRTVAADSFYLSPGHAGPLAAIHFTFKRDPKLVRRALNLIEKVLQPYGAMPHWGKVTNFSSHYIRSRYSNFGEFTEFVNEMDPQGVFSNHFLNQLL